MRHLATHFNEKHPVIKWKRHYHLNYVYFSTVDCNSTASFVDGTISSHGDDAVCLIRTIYSSNPSSVWITDAGCTSHMTPVRSYFTSCSPTTSAVRLATMARAPVIAIGTMRTTILLARRTGSLQLHEGFHVPSFPPASFRSSHGLPRSLSILHRFVMYDRFLQYSVLVDLHECQWRQAVAAGTHGGPLYYTDTSSSSFTHSSPYQRSSSSQTPALPTTADGNFWHCRFDLIDPSLISRMLTAKEMRGISL